MKAEVHIEERKDLPPERFDRGGVHHIAFRVDNDKELHAWIERIKQDSETPALSTASTSILFTDFPNGKAHSFRYGMKVRSNKAGL